MPEQVVIHQCDHIGIATTTDVHVKEVDGQFEARAGIAIFGSTNMTDAQMEAQGRNPFGDDWHDNIVRGIGDTQEQAIEALRQDAKEMAESLWI